MVGNIVLHVQLAGGKIVLLLSRNIKADAISAASVRHRVMQLISLEIFRT